MEQTEIQEKLRRIKNLSAFSIKAEVPRRTLERIKAGAGGYKANRLTLNAIEQALRYVKPEVRE